MSPILARQREMTRHLSNRLCAANRRIQAFLDSYLDGAAERPRLPAATFVLDQPGLARALSLPIPEQMIARLQELSDDIEMMLISSSMQKSMEEDS